MDISIAIATVNGSGSQSANAILGKALFRMGYAPGIHNVFPSNIAGLPTWTYLRASDKGYSSRRQKHDVVIARNDETWQTDLALLREGGAFLYDQALKIDAENLPANVFHFAIPFRELVQKTSDSIRMRRLLSNMVYIGILSEAMELPAEFVEQAVKDQFKNKENVFAPNIAALSEGRNFAREHLQTLKKILPRVAPISVDNQRLFIDGNSAAALGAVVGGCTFMSWYPITPATSLAESFQEVANALRDNVGGARVAVIQAEDELSAMSMLVGAGWMGARSMTSTSGPGLSLMAEAAGLAYFAEVPCVIWNVQRAGPSTGLPTRTMQADVTFAAKLSHGDTKHVLLFPANPKECFEFAQMAFDLADELQTLVICMSDLDLGMNPKICASIELPQNGYRRGKVLNTEDLEKVDKFERYADFDGDGIPYRTLPGTDHKNAAYFARGTSHTPQATYSEDAENFRLLLDRLAKKWRTAQSLMPASDIIETQSKTALLYYGSTSQAVGEVRDLLAQKGTEVSCLRLRSYPFAADVKPFLDKHARVYVIEQNRDGQMKGLLAEEYPELATKLRSVTVYDGMPVCATELAEKVLRMESGESR